ncbi:MAG: neutral/alkaline non-lysosomal ceramidase N-terminal domain-containing protein [Candidatus Hydrogenedentes bacterium]|nr:neutral/alkaline non-lysosomal ceramidase N-terminal domain-containing protein [Candidatus Hydrogenedentota bacterium]
MLQRISLSLLLGLLSVLQVQALEAGAAKVEITPPLDTPLNGYYDRLGRGALSVHDPVWVRCLFLDDDETPVLLVNSDLCMISRELRDRVLELAPAEVPKENILLTATHTHSAQGGMIRNMVVRCVSGRFVPEVLEATAQRFAEAMNQAIANRKRATIGFGVTTQTGLSVNRRVENGPTDPQIGVIRVDDSDGNIIALATNFAAHPTTVSGEDMMSISADYPGYYYNEVERVAGGSCVAMFLNGAEGNQRPATLEGKSGWQATEAIGTQLAAKAMEVAGTITCGEAKLHVGSSTPNLPPTLASDFVPSTTQLRTLEIGDLLLSFVPGEACVEIGLELRRLALERGYRAQFTVGLANDYLMYFVPRDLYPTLTYESAMTFYGPRIDSWFYREFDALMTRGTAMPERPVIEPWKLEEMSAGTPIVVSGDPFESGYRRGAAFREAIQATFQDSVVKPCDSGEWIPKDGLWGMAPRFMNLTPLALPRLGIGARPMLAGLSSDVLAEMEGVAEGAGMPFDAVWLTQCAPTFAAKTDRAPMYRSPFCTMFAAVGDRAGADDILAGRNFDWTRAEAPFVFDVRPPAGLRFLYVAFPWSLGVFTGMNEAGLAVSVERVDHLGEPTLDGPPVEFVLRGVLASAPDVTAASAALQAAVHVRGYHVMLVDASGKACVVEFGASITIREPYDGLLLGMDPATAGADPTAAKRYARLSTLLESERILDGDEIATYLRDADPGSTGMEQICNTDTRYSVVFVPKTKRMRVAFPDASGELGKPIEYGFGKQSR